MSVLETMISLSIISLLALAGIGSYALYYQHQELNNGVTQFFNALDFAKASSHIRGGKTYLCASTDGQTCNNQWQGELIVFQGDNYSEITGVLQKSPALPSKIQLSFEGFNKNDPFIYFMDNGEVANNGKLKFSYGDHPPLRFTLSATGIVSPGSSD